MTTKANFHEQTENWTFFIEHSSYIVSHCSSSFSGCISEVVQFPKIVPACFPINLVMGMLLLSTKVQGIGIFVPFFHFCEEKWYSHSRTILISDHSQIQWYFKKKSFSKQCLYLWPNFIHLTAGWSDSCTGELSLNKSSSNQWSSEHLSVMYSLINHFA